jgi:drug/metabolite transporter (DMT)-like permease
MIGYWVFDIGYSLSPFRSTTLTGSDGRPTIALFGVPVVRRLWHNFRFLMILVMVIWASTTSIVTQLSKRGLTVGEIVVFDGVLSALFMAALTLTVPTARRALFRDYRLRHAPWLLLCGLTGIFLYNSLLYKAMQSDVENVVPYVVINYLWPLTTLVFGVLILREKLTLRLALAAGCGFLGFLFIQVAGILSRDPRLAADLHCGAYADFARGLAASFGQARALGCLMAFAAAVLWGLFSAGARRISDTFHFEALSSLTWFTVAGAAVALAVYGPHCAWRKVLEQWDVALLLVVLAAGAHGLANLLWLRAIKVGGAGRTAVVAYLTPVLALLTLGLWQKQWPNWYSTIGLAVILGAVALAEVGRKPPAEIG